MKMKMNNLEIRELIERRRVNYYEIANQLGIDRSTLSRWLQTELTDERKTRVLKAIKSIKF